jgi:PAS domain S-box-containing protein
MRLPLLAPGKFPRLAAVIALVIPPLMVVDLLFLRPTSRGLLLCNGLDLASVVLAALCCFFAAQRARGFARQLWVLVGVGLGLESIGQAVTSYYQSFDRAALNTPVPSDIFFFVWAAPIFMILLPPSDDDSPGFDWLRVLDFLQIAIVALTMYLYFFYVPARWKANEFSVLSDMLLVYIVRDAVLALCFFFRWRSPVVSWFRVFCLVMALFFVGAVSSDAVFFYGLDPGADVATWGDLSFTIPYLLIVFFAVSWNVPQSGEIRFPLSKIGKFFTQQFLPIGFPLLVMLMAQAISREQFLFGWLAVIVSVVCSSVRLILTNRKTRRVAEDLIETEKALRVSEHMLSTAYRSSPDAFSINVFPNGPYLEINDGFTRLTGFTREETLGRSPGSMNLWVDTDDRGVVLERLQKTKEARDIEFRFRTKNGQIRFGQMYASVIEIDGRDCALVVVRDITARKEAEEILRTSEERFRSLVQNLHVGILTFDPEMRIIFANQAVVDLLRTSLDKLIGRTSRELGLIPSREDGSVIPEDERPIPIVLATRQPVRSRLVGWRRPNSSKQVWTLLDAVPEFSSTGELSRIVVSFTDMTEQRRAGEALRESEERFRTLVHDLQVAALLITPDREIEFANAAAHRMFNLPPGPEVTRVPSDAQIAVYSEDGTELDFADRPTEIAFRTGKAVHNFLVGLRHPRLEKTLWAFGNAIPQFDAQGNILRVIATLADVTQMKNAEREIHQLSTQLLRLQDEERRRLGRELHDGLAQTVLAINLNLAQARQSLQSDHSAVRALEKARALTQEMSREIRTLSYLLHPPLLDDLGLISALREYAYGFSERSSIQTTLHVETPFDRLPQVLELALFRIVQESLTNIQRHSSSRTAEIRLRQEDSLVSLEIIDFGCGMVVPSNGSTAPSAARLGVGIAGMRERISQLGGRLEIVSGPDGTKVRATISLSDLKVHHDVADLASRAS